MAIQAAPLSETFGSSGNEVYQGMTPEELDSRINSLMEEAMRARARGHTQRAKRIEKQLSRLQAIQKKMRSGTKMRGRFEPDPGWITSTFGERPALKT